jgi:hypothetical protein
LSAGPAAPATFFVAGGGAVWPGLIRLAVVAIGLLAVALLATTGVLISWEEVNMKTSIH